MTWTGDRHRNRKKQALQQRSGQALVFLLVILVILTLVVLWNLDISRVLFVKSITQNAGDSAALAAARWQGIFLNLVGDMNLLQAVNLSSGDHETAAAITNLQARLCFVGPMVAFMAAQQAAKNNRVYVNEEFTEFLKERSNKARGYDKEFGDDHELLFPPPYTNCWNEYGLMLDTIAENGVAASPENARFYDDTTGGGHFLLMIEFYEAIAGRIWCWFYRDAGSLLEDYRNFQPCWWPDLPRIVQRPCENSEIYGLGLRSFATRFSTLVDFTMAAKMADNRHLSPPLTTNGLDTPCIWYAYDMESWSEWSAISGSGEEAFPAIGPVKQQYNYAGADAAAGIDAPIGLLTPGSHGSTRETNVAWTAAAKPFGSLNEFDVPTLAGIVLPAFHKVRLIPLDTSSTPYGGAFNIPWRTHIAEHLPDYMRDGPCTTNGCWYCRQLATWEYWKDEDNRDFRQVGIDWLSTNSYLCTLPSYGGHHRGGGTRRGH